MSVLLKENCSCRTRCHRLGLRWVQHVRAKASGYALTLVALSLLSLSSMASIGAWARVTLQQKGHLSTGASVKALTTLALYSAQGADVKVALSQAADASQRQNIAGQRDKAPWPLNITATQSQSVSTRSTLRTASTLTVWDWGANWYGQLGNDSTNNSAVAIHVKTLSNVKSIAGGGFHSLALKDDGTVWAWGSNWYGQLGDGASGDGNMRLAPAQVSGLSSITAIADGNEHALALKSNGTVWAWGTNEYGQVGDGTETDRLTPVQVNGLSGVTAIVCGYFHSLALKDDGTVWTWGWNSYGQIGDGTSWTERLTPVQVSGLSGVTAVAGGRFHSLALKDDGTVWAWGWNTSGQIGDGTETDRLTPVQVSGLSGVSAIAGGSDHSFALKSDGTVWAWGNNYSGSLGDGTSINDRLTPVQVSGLSGVIAIAAGGSHSLALKNDGTVWAWGGNGYGQLGDGTQIERLTPVQVIGLSGVTAIAAGGAHSLVLSSQTSALPVAVDDTATTLKNMPVTIAVLTNDVDGDGEPLTVTDVGPAAQGGTVRINADGRVTYTPPWNYIGSDNFEYTISQADAQSASATVSVAVNDNGDAVAWGEGDFGRLGNNATHDSSVPVQVSNLSSVRGVAAGDYHSLALKNDGSIWAWGLNDYGELGDGTAHDSSVPAQVSDLSGVTAIAAGGYYSLALKNDGTVWAWGTSWDEQLGAVTHLTPMQVSSLSGVIAIAAGSSHSLALKNDGTVWAWGDNYFGQVGDGTSINDRLTPVQVSGLSGVIAIAAGGSHSLALKNDGTVWAWGANYSGEVGDGTSENNRLIPVQVSSLSGVTAISGGRDHSLAVKADGTVWGWGSNWDGQLGDGTSENNRLTPVRVSSLSGVTAISGGFSHSLALKNDGTVWAWGDNWDSQLGDGTMTDRRKPVPVIGLGGVKAIAAGRSHSLAVHGSWTGAGDAQDGIPGPSGQWNIGTNWASLSVPAANEAANIQLPGTYTVFLDANAAAGSLTLGTSDTTNGRPSLDLSGHTLALAAPGKIRNSGLVTGSGTIRGNVVCSGELRPATVAALVAAQYSGALRDTRDLNEGGGIINVSYNLTLESSAQSTIDIQGTALSEYDRIWTGRTLTLNGSVLVSFRNGFVPQPGQSFEIYKAATINGDFVTQQLPPLSNGVVLQWQRKANFDGNSPNTVSYVLTARAATPVITGFTPRWGQAGDSVSISGNNLSGASAVTFLGSSTSTTDDKLAVLPAPGPNFTNSLIKVKVPAGAVTGRLRVTTAGGNADTSTLSPANFTVLHRIGGVVRNAGGLALGGVAIDCINSNGLVRHITNNSNGSFSFQRLPAGTYTIKPVGGGAASSFNPLQQRVTLGSSDVSGVLFIGLAGPAISGRITNSTGNGVSGVVVRRTNRSSSTDMLTVRSNAQGYYGFSNVATGVTHRITPSLSGYSFNPPLSDVAMGSASVSNVHFVALQGAALSGRVTNSSTGQGLNGVTVRRLDNSGQVLETVVTNSNGYYGFSNVAVGSYRMRAMLSGWSFSPLARSVSVSSTGSTGSVSGIDFVGTSSTVMPATPTPSLRQAATEPSRYGAG